MDTAVSDCDSDLDECDLHDNQVYGKGCGSLDSDFEQSVDDDLDDDCFLEDLDYVVFPLCIEQADQMCIRLNQLIHEGVISKEKILYKFLENVIENLFDANHEWDKDVVEFYNTLKYLGGERVVNFIRGPMHSGTGKGGTKTKDTASLNLGGPSKTTRQKNKSGYTVESGVIKPWLQSFHSFAIENAEPLLSSDVVKVYAGAVENDGTALKPGIQFDEKQHVNVGLNKPATYEFVHSNPNPDPKYLKDHVVTESNVSYMSTMDNTVGMPVAVRYKPKAGKSGIEMEQQFLSEVKILQLANAAWLKQFQRSIF
jgi:hypothetical protein